MKKRRRVLALFISIFLRNRSLSDARWFYGKKRKIGKGNLYLTENWLSWNEMYCATDNHNYRCHTCAKEFLNLSFTLSSYWQNIKFLRYFPEFHIFTNIVIFQVYLQLLDQLPQPYKFYGRDMSGILFFIFASCEPLISHNTRVHNAITAFTASKTELVNITFSACSIWITIPVREFRYSYRQNSYIRDVSELRVPPNLICDFKVGLQNAKLCGEIFT